MEKLLLNLLEIAVVIRIGYTLFRWAFKSPKRNSIVGKLWRLASRSIHHKLDNAIKNQQRKYQLYKGVEAGKVVSFKNTR